MSVRPLGPFQTPGVDIWYLVRAMVKYKASDLHLKSGRPPLFRIQGKLMPGKMDALPEEGIASILRGFLTDRQFEDLERKRQIDLSFRIKDFGRFRCNAFYQRGSLSAAIRMIPLEVPQLGELGLPAITRELCKRPRGLLLVTGATGSGKSTTMAAMIRHINETSHAHVLMIEDPIEFIHRDQRSSVTQREVGSDATSIQEALIAGLRQDPDVIAIGELRDFETIRAALTAAETGHLVISTLHTNDARGTLSRIIDVFPAEAQNQIRFQLATNLIGVVSQQLVARADGHGLVPACEVLVKSPAIENYIRLNQIDRLTDAMASSNDYYRMQTMNQALERLVRDRLVSSEEALKASPNPDDLKLKLTGVAREEGYEKALGKG